MIKNETRGSSPAHKSCSDCGITHTPLWRGGPNGPRTMCNACGIRWKRAHQNGHKANKSHVEKAVQKLEELSEDESEQRSDEDSAEELMALSDPESTRIDTNVSSREKDLRDSAPLPLKKTIRRRLFQSSSRKPYDRTPISKDLNSQIDSAMFLLQQAAEEFDELAETSADDMSDSTSPIGASAGSPIGGSPVPIISGSAIHTTATSPMRNPFQDKMDLLFNEVIALRQEVQKRDAIIDMYKSSCPVPTSSQGKNILESSSLSQPRAL